MGIGKFLGAQDEPLTNNWEDGMYACPKCGQKLFESGDKFKSGTRWPSFRKAVPGAVAAKPDNSLGMERTEIRCSKCGNHLGHVFDDGKICGDLHPEAGMRYCVLSEALKFNPVTGEAMPSKPRTDTQKATFAAGCFWGVEEAFRTINGVKSTVVGYTGGKTKKPSYEDVCSDGTGHAEAVQIEFDPKVISFKELLRTFWSMHNPTTRDRQGPDIGSQYRSAVFYHVENQKTDAENVKNELDKKMFNGKIVTEIVMASEFWKAEEYHQKYHMKHGGSCNI